MSKPISIGKLRGLQQCSTKTGKFAILAVDHRNNLRNALNPGAPSQVTDNDMIAFKQDVVSRVGSHSTAVLLDPEVGALQCIASGALPGDHGLVLAVEATGYTGDPTSRESRLLDGWSIEKARMIGASAVKLLVYFHPDSPTASKIMDFISVVAEKCIQHDILLFVEPLSYSLDPNGMKLSSKELRRIVIETAKSLAIPGVDALKLEFPLSIQIDSDKKIWAAACEELSAACSVPWILLSAAVDFDTFLEQVVVACQSGASGVAVGRAVWKEGTQLTDYQRNEFLSTIASNRMARATALCEALARPWQDFYHTATPDGNWYKKYGQ